MDPIIIKPDAVISFILAFGGLLTALGVIVGAVSKTAAAAHKPQAVQDEKLANHEARLNDHESQLKKLKELLDDENRRLHDQAESDRVIQQGLLALMSHALNGNDIDKLTRAKENLEQYLINKG